MKLLARILAWFGFGKKTEEDRWEKEHDAYRLALYNAWPKEIKLYDPSYEIQLKYDIENRVSYLDDAFTLRGLSPEEKEKAYLDLLDDAVEQRDIAARQDMHDVMIFAANANAIAANKDLLYRLSETMDSILATAKEIMVRREGFKRFADVSPVDLYRYVFRWDDQDNALRKIAGKPPFEKEASA